MRSWLYLLIALLGSAGLHGAETPPPVPTRYFNDYAAVVSTAAAKSLNTQLEHFEEESSNQLLVVVYPQMPSSSSMEDFTHRTMESWQLGQRAKNNGVALFVFIADRSARIEVNYGLEGSLPDATCKRILEEVVLPRFRENDYEGGLSAGIAAIQQATKGEYQGTGSTAAAHKTMWWVYLFYGAALLMLLGIGYSRHRAAGAGTLYDRNGSRLYTAGLLLGLLGGAFGGGSSGGGGFSGGGGSGGGGGASGRW